MRLSAWACPSLTDEVVARLEAQGVRGVTDLMLRDCQDLAREASVSYRELRSIRRVAIAHHSVFAVSGRELLHQAIHNTKVFSTGCKMLDRLVEGGLTTGEVVEVCGGSGEGKTTLCLQLALHAALEQGLSVLYVDPVGSLNHLRVNPLVEALPHDLKAVEDALSRIKVTGASDVWEVFAALRIATQPFIPVRYGQLDEGGAQDGDSNLAKIKLVIIDSLASVMLPLITKEDSKQGLAILNQLAVRLKTVAKEQQVAVVVVNNVVQAGSGHNNLQHHTAKPKWMPALGRFWRSVPRIRLYVRRVRGTDPPVVVRATSEDECLVPKSPLALNVAVWKGTRIKAGRAVVTLPLTSLSQSSQSSS
ncbi:DNA repair protein RAD51 homolog 4-like [Portunus trituberculatus]|uniref:DNA repair protein RAD51 homolog 4-like n=1 Tax=Portunus trituberculatus TaxID=210409 RepID=UPI001E1D0D8C|nr:DNA repair protein RAD51 homolog 4-like [Portunus trituberculatus]